MKKQFLCVSLIHSVKNSGSRRLFSNVSFRISSKLKCTGFASL
nr:MAG TPA: hypothetical protein [Caudoviricetes sp.]